MTVAWCFYAFLQSCRAPIVVIMNFCLLCVWLLAFVSQKCSTHGLPAIACRVCSYKVTPGILEASTAAICAASTPCLAFCSCLFSHDMQTANTPRGLLFVTPQLGKRWESSEPGTHCRA